MAGKISIIKATAKKYQKVSGKKKTDLLDDLEKTTHLHQSWALAGITKQTLDFLFLLNIILVL